jgi:ribonuclease PH
VQGTAEGEAFTRAEMDALLALASAGLSQLFTAQREAITRSAP